ncbi:MAG: response regulator transcription factor [Desulfuromonadaceae bacterium]|nr:response regulator transcription factor [Desulfuromonadaceae bacterium]
MPVLSILIAEDNPKDFEFLEQLLHSSDMADFTIERAPNGKAALEMALKKKQPLVISDIQMPELNGIDFAKALWDQKPEARIVFWSQFKDEMYVRSLLKIVPPETVYGYILKSNTRERIAAAVTTVLLDEQCWIDPEVRKVQGRTGHSQTALSDIEFEALIDISLGLTDNLIAQRRYLSRRGVQSRLNSLYNKLSIDQEQFQAEKVGDGFNPRNRAVAVALHRGLINPFELEHEEQELQKWLVQFKKRHKISDLGN